ncbi:DUF5723 family protein [Maribacter confluentis]|uniref:DUF5723 family protein n=1 Tax=Maribacter confluentis TaxID=1656093 RepID=A0ABT8RQ72_9FLAO|nr:DUF5723 family protein [Maribacter confluentis]MDO1513071.1 DUF5723 family protein [Maribacter confluentis]
MKYLVFTLLLFLGQQLHAQDALGYQTDNYSGIHGIFLNPGTIADSRIKTEVNLFSANSLLATDYTYLSLENLSGIFGDDGFAGLERYPLNDNEIIVNAEVLGPSFMFSLNEKNSLAIYTRLRLASNFNNINGELFEGIYDGFPNSNFNFQQENLDFTTHAWAEIGGTYGRVLFNNTNNLFKGGITLKYLVGGGAVQGNSSSLTGAYDTQNEQVALNGNFSYAVSFDDEQEAVDYFKELSYGFGTDIGFIYEYRNATTLADSNANNPRGFNQYKIKIGLSIIDIGSITYTNAQITNYTIDANVNAQELEEDFIEVLDNNASQNVLREPIKLSLPTSMNLNIDYNIYKKFYLNLNYNQSLVNKVAFFNNNGLNLITLTPRYESRIFGAYLPISTSNLGKTAIGAGIRVGPLYLGSGTVFTNLSKKSNMANVYLGLKIPVYHKRKNKV